MHQTRWLALLILLVASTVSQLTAQDRSFYRKGLPRPVTERVNARLNDPNTRVIEDSATISERVTSDVVVLNGHLVLTGTIDGELIIVDGSADFRAGSRVAGDVTVIGGIATGYETASIDGTITLYERGFGPLAGDAEVFTVNSRTKRVYREDHRRRSGYSRLTLGSTWNYNRVEGLPVHFGPQISTGGRNPTRLEALAIWRTDVASPWDSEDWGYRARLEQFLGGRRDLRLGASIRSVIEPIESWQLANEEAALAAFVLHNDYRDHFLREGWSTYLRYTPRATGVSATLEYRDETHSSEAARDPWTLFDNSEPWRLQPLVAEGKLRSINAALEVDRRDDDDFATSGFFLRADIMRSLRNKLVLPGFVSPVATAPVEFADNFTHGLIDARVYRPVRGGRDAVALRLAAGGALSDTPMPPQFQHALGGPGAVPGYATFSADCGARTVAGSRVDEGAQFFQGYGCDRFAMVSAEYRSGFDAHFRGHGLWDDDDDWDWNMSPNWVVFFDAARGWAHAEAKARGAFDTETLYDAGVGLMIGDLGVYGAIPLNGEDRDLRFFIRLGQRF